MSLRLTPEERALVLAWREMLNYAAARRKLDSTRDEPREELVYLELHTDTSGTIRVESDEPGDDASFVAVVFTSIEEASEKIVSANNAITNTYLDRAVHHRKVGDPRKGRKLVDEDCQSDTEGGSR